MSFYGLLMVSIIVVLLLAEVIPEAVNALLVLILLGVVLLGYKKFQELVEGITLTQWIRKE